MRVLFACCSRGLEDMFKVSASADDGGYVGKIRRLDMMDLKDYERMFESGNYFTIAVEARKLLDALEEQEAIIKDLRKELEPERTMEYEAQLFRERLIEANKALEAADELAKFAYTIGVIYNLPDLKEEVQEYRAVREGK